MILLHPKILSLKIGRALSFLCQDPYQYLQKTPVIESGSLATFVIVMFIGQRPPGHFGFGFGSGSSGGRGLQRPRGSQTDTSMSAPKTDSNGIQKTVSRAIVNPRIRTLNNMPILIWHEIT